MTSRNLRLGHNFCFAIALLLLGCGIAQAQELEGSWRLAMRKLPDGTTQVPPAVLVQLDGSGDPIFGWFRPRGACRFWSSETAWRGSD
jgi:hypothetical protein